MTTTKWQHKEEEQQQQQTEIRQRLTSTATATRTTALSTSGEQERRQYSIVNNKTHTRSIIGTLTNHTPNDKQTAHFLPTQCM